MKEHNVNEDFAIARILESLKLEKNVIMMNIIIQIFSEYQSLSTEF